MSYYWVTFPSKGKALTNVSCFKSQKYVTNYFRDHNGRDIWSEQNISTVIEKVQSSSGIYLLRVRGNNTSHDVSSLCVRDGPTFGWSCILACDRSICIRIQSLLLCAWLMIMIVSISVKMMHPGSIHGNLGCLGSISSLISLVSSESWLLLWASVLQTL